MGSREHNYTPLGADSSNGGSNSKPLVQGETSPEASSCATGVQNCVKWCTMIILIIVVIVAIQRSPLSDGPRACLLAIVFCFVVTVVSLIPVGPSSNTSSYTGGIFSFTLNGVDFTPFGYFINLYKFSAAASSADWKERLEDWFAGLATQEKPNVGFGPCPYTRMCYDYDQVKEQLLGLGAAIDDGTMKRESELAMGVFNNLMWPEVGRFSLGFTNDEHALVRPYLAKLFDDSQGERWNLTMLKEIMRAEMAAVDTIVEGSQPGGRGNTDLFSPAKSETWITQVVLRVLHKVALGYDLSKEQSIELSALQTLVLAPAGCPGQFAQGLLMWKMIGQRTVEGKAKFMKIYKEEIPKRFPNDHWDEQKLTLAASAFLDAMLAAGGRSVPLGLDIVMGYLLMEKKPDALVGIDFTDEANLQALIFEVMRLHAPVTTVPRWVTGDGGKTWQHEGICLHKAGYDPKKFERPTELMLNRSQKDSIYWADFALVDGKNEHPNSHACPGKQLSINMMIAFVKEYQAAGPWRLETPEIEMTYYGTKGFKLTKASGKGSAGNV